MIGIEGLAVMFGGPQSSRLLVGEGDGGLVVADAFGKGERPGAGAVERLLLVAHDLRRAQYGASTVVKPAPTAISVARRTSVAYTRVQLHDTMRPSRYGMTPWNARGSVSNTSGRKWRSPSHIGRSRIVATGFHSSVPSALCAGGVPE